MRIKRSKQYRKLMQAYQVSFGFREPYQVLFDETLVVAASRFRMNLGSRLEDTLSGEIKPMITTCSMRHLYNLEAKTKEQQLEKDSCIEVAKAAERRRCGHHELEEPLSTLECLQSVVDPKDSGTNKHRYVVASQNLEVRAKMRDIAGVPLIYINRSVMILEPMAGKTEQVREREEKGKIRAGLKGRRGAEAGLKRKREDDVVGEQDAAVDGEARKKKKRVRGPKQPNPLSVMKPKTDKKPVARHVEDERTIIRKAAKGDPQADEKALHTDLAVDMTTVDEVGEGTRKRKRKRKVKEGPDTAMSIVDEDVE